MSQKPGDPAPTKEKSKAQIDREIDDQSEDSFPASDPPSYSGGNHVIGAPTDRESDSPTSEHPAVLDAEKKVNSGDAKRPHKY